MDEALNHIFENTPEPLVEECSTVSDYSSLRHRILAEDVHSERPIPSTHATNVDGYAVKSPLAQGIYTVWTSESHPLPLTAPLPDNIIYRVNTGGSIPEGADAVVMVEDTKIASTISLDGKNEEKEIEVLAEIEKGENVRNPGSDVSKGDLVLAKGTLLSDLGGEVGTLHFVGRQKVKAYKRPIVAVLSTGNEIVDLASNSASTSAAIFDTNRPALILALQASGYQVIDLGIVKDTVQAVTSALQRGIKEADVIIATGGTSMGEVDLLKPVIERHLNGTIHFGRVAMKPGKPTTFASVPAKTPSGNEETLIFSLPGNPASALVTFNLFVVPCLRKLSGYEKESWQLTRVKVRLANDLSMDNRRPEFHRVHIKPSQTEPYLEAHSTGGQRSSKASSMATANGLVCLPSKDKAGDFAARKGDLADCVVMGAL